MKVSSKELFTSNWGKWSGIIFFILFLLITVPNIATARTISSWAPKYEGIWTATGYDTSPRLMRAYAIRVDLDNPNVSLYASHGNGGSPGETTLETTPAFLSSHNLEAAVNANFFNTVSTYYADNSGLLVSNGTTVSEANSVHRIQLLFTQDLVGSFVNSTTTPTGYYTAIGGHVMLVTWGSNIGANEDVEPRTAIGISSDGRFLIMVVVDGRQTGYSEGATYYDMGEWLLDFGAHNGAAFDGGGSSTICTASDGVLNSPSDGSPRPVGASLGTHSSTYNPMMAVWMLDDVSGQVVKRAWLRSHGWYSWNYYGKPADANIISSPVATSRLPEMIDLFVLGDNGNIYQRTYDNGTWDANWISCGGSPANVNLGQIDVCSRGFNRIDIVAVGDDGNLWRKAWGGSSWSSWINVENDGNSLDPSLKPAIVSWGVDRLDIFAQDGYGNIYHKYAQGGVGWSDWSSPIYISNWDGELCAVSEKYGELYLFYMTTATSPHTISYKTYNGTTWSGGNLLGGTFAGGPAACSYQEGVIMVCGQSTDGYLYKKYRVNGTWDTNWSGLGGLGTMVGCPDGSSWSNDPLTHFP